MQQQADQSVFKHHVEHVAGQEDKPEISRNGGSGKHNQNHSPNQGKERREDCHLVAPPLSIRNPRGPVDIGSDSANAEQNADQTTGTNFGVSAPEEHCEHQPEGIQVQEHLSNCQSLGNIRVIPTALRHG